MQSIRVLTLGLCLANLAGCYSPAIVDTAVVAVQASKVSAPAVIEVTGALVLNGSAPSWWLGVRDQQNTMWRLQFASVDQFHRYSALQNQTVKVLGVRIEDDLSNPQLLVQQ
jgi:hypothetical protein